MDQGPMPRLLRACMVRWWERVTFCFLRGGNCLATTLGLAGQKADWVWAPGRKELGGGGKGGAYDAYFYWLTEEGGVGCCGGGHCSNTKSDGDRTVTSVLRAGLLRGASGATVFMRSNCIQGTRG